jgi:deaminated glutathione amidase
MIGLPCDMRVAAVQFTAVRDRRRNLDRAASLVEEAATAGAELVVLPEYFSVAGRPDDLRNDAESLTGPTVTWASEQARRWGIHLVAGSFPERAGPSVDTDGRLFNTSCLLGPSGSLDAVYRKIHLFDVALPGMSFRESDTIAPGDTVGVVPLGPRPGLSDRPESVLGLSICYDLRFPEPYRIMTLLGATVVAVPAAFTAVTGPAHWELLLRARAVENQVFVIGAGQVGDLPPGMPRCHGRSMIVDPWGEILAERTEPTPGVIVADLDEQQLRRIRSELPVLANRRPAAYRWPDERIRGTAEPRQ